VTTARPIDLETEESSRSRSGDLVLRWPPNWTGVVFFAVLAGLHLCICIPAFFHGRIEGYMSLIFATIFSTVSVLCLRLSSELAILPSERMIRLRTRVWRFVYERKVPFTSIRGVRLTLCNDKQPPESIIELLCPDDDVQCPPTNVPREEALCLAMTINVPLIKAYAGATPPARPA
jgi:hypothetical protein